MPTDDARGQGCGENAEQAAVTLLGQLSGLIGRSTARRACPVLGRAGWGRTVPYRGSSGLRLVRVGAPEFGLPAQDRCHAHDS